MSGAAESVAEGLYRLAADRAPNWYVPYDRLAIMRWRHGAQASALEAVRESAAVLPSFHLHHYQRLDEIPIEFRETFADAAWEAMQADPRLQAARFLLGLAEMERLNKRHDRALNVLDRVEGSGADARQRAHAALIRGRALFTVGRLDEARESFEKSQQDAVFEPFALMELARVAEAQGRDDEALQIRAELRWKAPDLPGPSLDYAASLRAAGNLEPALVTVRLVVANHPDALRARAMLVDLLLRLRSLDEAETEIAEMESRQMTAVAAQLRTRLERARGIARER